MPPRGWNGCARFVPDCALELANMAELYKTPPSRILRISDPLTAWALDEGIAQVMLRLRNGDKLRPKRTGNNIDMLKAMGVEIEGLKEE